MKTSFNFNMISKSLMAIAFIAFLSTIIYSCGNSSSKNENEKKATDSATVKTKSDDSLGISPKVTVTSEDMKPTDKTTGLTITESIAKAEKDANAVFLVVTDSAKTNLTKALKLAKSASLLVKNSVVISMDREDKSNKELVTEYGIAGAPLPVILVISPKGNLADGFVLDDATVDLLVKTIPSPMQDDVLKALDNKKSVFLVVSKSSFTDKAKAVETCKAAIKLNGNKSELVQIDLADAKESDFLEMMKVNKATTVTGIIVVNTKGQVTGSFYEPKDAASLVALANKVQSGCGSGCTTPCK